MKNVRSLCIAASLLATACGGGGGSTPMTDSGSTPDAGHIDGGPMADTGPGTDTGPARPDMGPGHDAGPSMALTGSCMMPVDLATAGMALTTGTGRTIRGNNTMASAMPVTGLAQPSCATDTSMMPPVSAAGYTVVFQYHVTQTAFVEATTDDMNTDANLDTVVWILDGCSDTAMELACNDDDANGRQSDAVSAHTVMAGSTVYIMVAGYSPPTTADWTNQGAFQLTVRELVPHAAGDACDQANRYCVDGYACVPTGPMAMTGTCNAYGTDNAPCNLMAPFCNMGLQCSTAMPSAADQGVCQVPIAAGMPCTADHFVCVTGATCIADMGSMTMGHCINDGSMGGACRAMAPECDMGLTCDMTTGLCM
jgi:hypothetical protein